MDDFVNWDGIAPDSIFSDKDTNASLLGDLDLVLANVVGDDFSFAALDHFETSNPAFVSFDPIVGEAGDQPQTFDASFGTPAVPCAQCQRNRLSCKTINEGEHQGYCTSCIALSCECSFGLASGADTPSNIFPANPWPTFGDHPRVILQEDMESRILHTISNSGPDLAASTASTGSVGRSTKTSGAKAVRFSQEALKILRTWHQTHAGHPYPTEEEKEMLQKQTGLNKTQISNWLANFRRRNRVTVHRSTSPGVRTFSNAIDIPQRRGTPSFEHMKPLERWRNSPPEHEPALVTDIARAIASSSATKSSPGLDSPFSGHFTDDGSSRSLWGGSTGASSAQTSRSSGGSLASAAFSHGSHGSSGSFGSMSINRGRRRRRRKATTKRPDNPNPGRKTPLQVPLKTFQCTFCTETFNTKYDWQRHEKSLHLSLERWMCAPDGPRALDPETNCVSCVFCGQPNPDDAHVDSHNYSVCQERSLEERTFYRKDHLRQHLKLVHGSKFMTWSMEPWSVATPEIRSRCGFCGIIMDTWTIRIDHLAQHFKAGKSMADWTGDWGFEAPVLAIVENSIPPYLIHDERNSPLPFEATRGPPESPTTAYELLKGELLFFLWNTRESSGVLPTDEQLQYEACRILYGADVLSKKDISTAPSWLRDLLLSSEKVAHQAKHSPIRRQNENRVEVLKIIGKDNIFEEDSMERQLHEYVKLRRNLGLTALDSELQVTANNILHCAEKASNTPSADIANFLRRLVCSSTHWLAGFRQRASLPRSEDIMDVNLRSKDFTTIDSTIHNYGRLEAELSEFVKVKSSEGVIPSDAELQRQARLIIYEKEDDWNQTLADDAQWLLAFKQKYLHYADAQATIHHSPIPIEPPCQYALDQPFSTANPLAATTNSISAPTPAARTTGYIGGVNAPVRLPAFFLNDANCYRRLARELSRWVAATMSPNNPNRHIPSDEELQHQARYILYDTGDPFNQTAADNAEWLKRFKKDAGIISDQLVPGLPDGAAWNIMQGGSGFAPPYALPNQNAFVVPLPQTDRIAVPITAMGEGIKSFETDSATANKYLQSLAQGRIPPPAVVFCSRELENGLGEYVTAATAPFGLGQFPSDEALRTKAREIIGTQNTPADDAGLLEKFKNMMRNKLELGLDGQTAASTSASESHQQSSTASSVGDFGTMPLDGNMDLTGTMQDIDWDMFSFNDDPLSFAPGL